MGKLKDLGLIKTASTAAFVYAPPDSAYGAGRILLLLDTRFINMELFISVLRGIRRVNPQARLVIIDRVDSEAAFDEAGITAMLDQEMRVASVTDLLTLNYRNQSPEPAQFITMTAPGYFEEYDCVICMTAFKQIAFDGADPITLGAVGQIASAAVEGRLMQPEGSERVAIDPAPDTATIIDAYFSIGQYVHGAIVDLTHKYEVRQDKSRVTEVRSTPVGNVVWGDNLLAVDETACRLAAVDLPEYITRIRRLQQQARSES